MNSTLLTKVAVLIAALAGAVSTTLPAAAQLNPRPTIFNEPPYNQAYRPRPQPRMRRRPAHRFLGQAPPNGPAPAPPGGPNGQAPAPPPGGPPPANGPAPAPPPGGPNGQAPAPPPGGPPPANGPAPAPPDGAPPVPPS